MNQVQFEIVDLPSKGIPYDQTSPLKTGQIKLKYPTAVEQDILLSQNLIRKGVMLDQFLKSLIVDKTVNYDQLLNCDKQALYITARIMAYGSQYPINVVCNSCLKEGTNQFQLENLKFKDVDYSRISKNNEINIKLNKDQLIIKLLNGQDEKEIQKEKQGFLKLNPTKQPPTTSIRYTKMITSINGDTDKSNIKKYSFNIKLRDSINLKKQINRVIPGINNIISYKCPFCNTEQDIQLPITKQFFYPSF